MRGQTTLDFAIGISIFLAVILFVFLFVPGLLEPFSVSGEDRTVVANQVADRLAQDQLGGPDEPHVLDRYCTVQFFQDSPDDAGPCRFDDEPLEDRLRLSTGNNVNITLVGNFSSSPTTSEPLCWDGNDHEVRQMGSGECGNSADTNLTIGGVPPAGNDATITARRVVSLDGRTVTMEVVVW